MPELKIAQLRHFLWVAELQSFQAAATRAHRSQPTISLSIKDLEEKLGQPLFESGTGRGGRTCLTPFGASVIQSIRELVSHHDRVQDDIGRLTRRQGGHVRVAAVPSIAARVLPRLLRLFSREYPDIRISLFDDNADAILKAVDAHEVDFGLATRGEGTEHENKEFTPIWEDSLGVACLKTHMLAQSNELSWQQLKGHRLINNGTSQMLKGTQAEDLLANPHLHISNMISLTAVLEAGVGVTTLPSLAFPEGHSSLAFIPLTDPLITRETGIVRLSERSLSPAAQALFSFIRSDGESD